MSIFSKHSQTILLGVELLGATSIVLYHWYLLRQRWLRQKERQRQQKEGEESQIVPFIPEEPGYLTPKEHWNTAIFFPDALYMQEDSKIHQLIWYMQQTKNTLKICIFVAKFSFLENAIFEIIKKNRIVVLGISNTAGSVYRWKKKGIQAREKPKVVRSAFSSDIFVDLMHNKFIVIDDKAVIGGSLNWTSSAITENRENIVITTHPNIVPKYVSEFKRLWEYSAPNSNHRERIQHQPQKNRNKDFRGNHRN